METTTLTAHLILALAADTCVEFYGRDHLVRRALDCLDVGQVLSAKIEIVEACRNCRINGDSDYYGFILDMINSDWREND